MSVLIYPPLVYHMDYHSDGGDYGSCIPSTNAKPWYMVVDHVMRLLTTTYDPCPSCIITRAYGPMILP